MKRVLFCFLIGVSFCSPAFAQEDFLLTVLSNELEREVKEFAKAELPPYFISYRVNDLASTHLQSSFGSLVESSNNSNRLLFTTVRVGSYELDNTHPMEKSERGFGGMGDGSRSIQIPLDNSQEAIQFLLWRSTQNNYRQALESFKAIKSTPRSTKKVPNDFSKAKPEIYFEKPLPASEFDKAAWEAKVRKYSAPFLKNADLVAGDVSLEMMTERKYIVTSEGTRVAQNMQYAYLMISASIRAVGGDIVPLHRSFFAFSLAGLPDDNTILKEVENVISKLIELREAPLVDAYTGPAILDAQVGGVFFHEIFGHRVEGERLRNDMDSQTFKEKINQPVLNKTLTVIFDPTLKEFEGKPLNGYYLYDDEGIKGQRVAVVDKGILKTFLMSRSPLESVLTSNGHGRADAVSDPVSRQSNLIVQTSKPMSFADLRKTLIQEAKKQGKPYGYYFKDVVGGFTTTDRFSPNAFNIFPTEVYRIYADGKPDQLVRGVDLIGTPLAMFAEITAAGNESKIFTGFCGAESGSVPVTAISPALFVRRIETQKKFQTDIESTLLSRPVKE